MSPKIQQAFSVTVLTAIITPIVVAIFLGAGSYMFSKSEEVTRIVAVLENTEKNMNRIASNVSSLESSVTEISTQSATRHLDVLIAIMDSEKKSNAFRSKINARVEAVEQKVASDRGQIKYILGRLNPNRVVEGSNND